MLYSLFIIGISHKSYLFTGAPLIKAEFLLFTLPILFVHYIYIYIYIMKKKTQYEDPLYIVLGCRAVKCHILILLLYIYTLGVIWCF